MRITVCYFVRLIVAWKCVPSKQTPGHCGKSNWRSDRKGLVFTTQYTKLWCNCDCNRQRLYQHFKRDQLVNDGYRAPLLQFWFMWEWRLKIYWYITILYDWKDLFTSQGPNSMHVFGNMRLVKNTCIIQANGVVCTLELTNQRQQWWNYYCC